MQEFWMGLRVTDERNEDIFRMDERTCYADIGYNYGVFVEWTYGIYTIMPDFRFEIDNTDVIAFNLDGEEHSSVGGLDYCDITPKSAGEATVTVTGSYTYGDGDVVEVVKTVKFIVSDPSQGE